jgi:hypothetical protein
MEGGEMKSDRDLILIAEQIRVALYHDDWQVREPVRLLIADYILKNLKIDIFPNCDLYTIEECLRQIKKNLTGGK